MQRLRRLARKHRVADNSPPPLKTAKLKAAVRSLRRTVRDDDPETEIINEAQRLLDAGWTVRRGPDSAASKPRPLPKELEPYAAQWKKPPPEWGEQ
jgi:hypothetical protein